MRTAATLTANSTTPVVRHHHNCATRVPTPRPKSLPRCTSTAQQWSHIRCMQPSGYAASVLADEVVSDGLTETSPGEDGSVEQFEWTKQWYPVGVVDMLDPSRPHQVQLLGKMMVLWRDGSGVWQCFEDKCPHRLVPLSEGRVEADGTLLCAYHAWRFDGTGKCVGLPQAKTKELEQRACESPKACAVVYPTQERHGIIFAWPESGPLARLESQQRPLRLVPEMDDDSGRVKILPLYQADMPYGWDYFIENVTDPAHVPVSHHKMAGNRYTDPKFIDISVQRPLSTQEGISCAIQPPSPGVRVATTDFQPPCLVRIDSRYDGGANHILVLYATPTRPGWVRHIGRQILIADEDGKQPKGLSIFGLPMPVWLLHVLAPLFLFQDMVLLHGQGLTMAEKQENFMDAYYMPTPQDKMLTYFRQWLQRRAGGGVPWPEGMDPKPIRVDSATLFNVYDIHTKNCKHCLSALKKINSYKWVAAIAAVVCILQGAVMSAAHSAAHAAALGQSSRALGLTVPPMGALLCAGLGLALAAASVVLHKLSGMFYEYKYSHADNN